MKTETTEQQQAQALKEIKEAGKIAMMNKSSELKIPFVCVCQLGSNTSTEGYTLSHAPKNHKGASGAFSMIRAIILIMGKMETSKDAWIESLANTLDDLYKDQFKNEMTFSQFRDTIAKDLLKIALKNGLSDN